MVCTASIWHATHLKGTLISSQTFVFEWLTIKVQLIVHAAGLQDSLRLHVVIHNDLHGPWLL